MISNEGLLRNFHNRESAGVTLRNDNVGERGERIRKTALPLSQKRKVQRVMVFFRKSFSSGRKPGPTGCIQFVTVCEFIIYKIVRHF